MSQKHATLSGTSFNGIDVHEIGDVNGDGVVDLATGTGAYFNSSAWLAVWSGSDIAAGGSLSQSDALAIISGSNRGGETAGGFDVDGDGIPDVISAYNTETQPKVAIVSGVDILGGINIGLADQVLISGSASNADGEPTAFAHDMGIAEDIDSDGYAEVMIAASKTDTALASAGRVYIIDGHDISSSGAAADLSMIKIDGADECGELSTADRSADFDGDGVADIMVSQLNSDAFNCQNSIFPTTHIFLGSDLEEGSYLATDASGYFASRDYSDGLGMDAHGFDMDLDGDDDIMLSAPLYADSLGYTLIFTSHLTE